jgi:hypothetical protein
MSRELYTCGQVATKVGIPRSRLAYLIEAGRLPGPSMLVPGRRLFTTDDISRIQEVLGEKPNLRFGRRGTKEDPDHESNLL